MNKDQHTSPSKHLKDTWLIKDAIGQGLTKSTSTEEARKEFTCHDCVDKDKCRFAWDAYNLNGDCLASK